MRLPRNIKMLKGPVDSSMLAGTLFLLWVVTLLHSSLVLPPGVRLRLPAAAGVWGEVIPQLSVAVDDLGRLFFEHQLLSESNLVSRLHARTIERGPGQTLLILADRAVSAETLAHLFTLARSAGIEEVVMATSPRPGTAGNGAAGSGGRADSAILP